MDLLKSLCGPLMLALLAAPALAQNHQHGHGDAGRHWHREPERHWRGDIRHFHQHDFNHWRQGRWYNGYHAGRRGWWWIVGPAWYWYPAPVYPYPDPYAPPLAIAPVAPAAPAAPVAPAAPATSYWYWCPDSRQYYPYVPDCRSPWQQVPARP
jgi:hypothetical protein